MLNKDTTDIKEQVIKDHFDSINENAQGKVIELSAAPTASAPLLEAGEIGKFGNDIYERVENTILKFSSDDQIVIT